MPQVIGGGAPQGGAEASNPPMDLPKYELPAWLPWATTACLAALVACLAEFHFIEASRSELLREEAQLAESAAAAARNQLEAERILDARQIRDLGEAPDSGANLQVILLRPVEPRSSALGVVVLDPLSGRGLLRLFGEFLQPPEGDLQLWVDGRPPVHPALCGVIPAGHAAGDPVRIRAAVSPGCRIVLKDPAGAGSIILASTPLEGRNLGR